MTLPPANVSGSSSTPPRGARKSYNQVAIRQVHDNTSQDVIHITEDKLRLALIAHLDGLAKQHAWHVPLSLFVSAIVVFFTSSFKDLLGVKADKIEVAFIIFSFICFIWLVKAGYSARKSISVEELILKIKNK